MIYRYRIRKVSEAYYSQSEDMLMSRETSYKMAISLVEDKMYSEASWYNARAKEGTQWIPVSSISGYTAFYNLPGKVRRRISAGDRRRVERGQEVTFYACIY